MKVMICGGNSCSQIIEIVYNEMLRREWEVHYLPTRARPKSADNLYLMDQLIIEVRSFRPDLILWMMCSLDCRDGVCDRLRTASPNSILVCHSFDDPYVIDQYGSPWVRGFDRAVTCSLECLSWYEDRGVKAICLYPPVDSSLHGAANRDPSKACDISFAVTNVYPKSRYPDVLLGRSDIISALDEEGFNLFLYGPWQGSSNSLGSERGVPHLQHLHKGVVAYKDMPTVFSSSKINLNSHVRPSSFGYLNERVFTSLAAGGFMLTDHVSGLESTFKLGTHLDAWSDLDELIEKCRYYLHHDDERLRIAREGQEYVLGKFSSQCFVDGIIGLM